MAAISAIASFLPEAPINGPYLKSALRAELKSSAGRSVADTNGVRRDSNW